MRAMFLAPLLCALSLPADAADNRFLAFGDSITVGHGAGGILCPDNAAFGGLGAPGSDPEELGQAAFSRM